MAGQTNYNQGVASVTPTEDTPSDYLNARATPASFGGEIAQGGEALGKGMLTSSQFFGKVAADNASNDFQDFATKLLHGDPSKTTPGPDGQPMPDTGYLGTRGRATLDQRPDVEKQMDDRLKSIRETLTSPDQQLEFDNFSRRYRSMVQERIGSHADGQATTWYQSVNTNSAKLAMDHIANNFDNPNEVAGGASDLTAAYVKNAQLQGATPDSPQMKEAFASARRDALDAQLNAMAVKDPSRALAILDKNKDIAGTKYDDLANKFRVRADQQRGQDIGEQAIRKTYQGAAPAGFEPVDLTAAGAPYGISGSYLQRVHQIEGNGTSSTGAQGPFQFVPSTARQYGLKNPFDMQQSADAAARLAADNRTALTDRLGRPPTDAELYLAHQQGSDGAAKLLANPNARAGDIVGDKAIRVNGGDPNAPASQFTSLWATKFAGAPGQANAMRKASAYQDILSNPDIDPNVRQHALAYVNQQMTAQQVAEEQDAKAKKAVSDQAMDKYVNRMLTGQNTGNMVNEIANDANLTPEVKWHLGEAVQKASGSDVQAATQTYGPGFWNAYKQVTAPMGDPSRISDPSALLQLAGRDMDDPHGLTLAGVQKLQTMMRENAKSVDAASVNTTKTGLLNYAKSKLSFEQDTGPVKIRDPEGEAIFNARFIPKFETAYDKWIKDGKNPYEFLTQENVDKLMTGMRDKSKMENARLNATGEGLGVEAPIPAAPAGVDQKAWQGVLASPPRGKNGPWPTEAWAGAINRLRSDPSPETKAAFDQWFAPSGYTADAILKRLPVPERDISTEGMPDPETGVAEPPQPGIFERIRKSNQDALKRMNDEPDVLHKAATGAASLLNKVNPENLKPAPVVGMAVRG